MNLSLINIVFNENLERTRRAFDFPCVLRLIGYCVNMKSVREIYGKKQGSRGRKNPRA